MTYLLAQATSQPSWVGMMPLVFIGFFFYFFLLRPQQKQQREHKKMVADVKRGDKVVLTSGIYADVIEVADATILVCVAPNVNIKVDKTTIGQIQDYKPKV